MDIEKLTKDLKELCAEGNNGDYYLGGFVDADALESIIREHLDPDYRYFNKHWGRHPTVNHEITPNEKIILDVYNNIIRDQLEQESYIFNRVFGKKKD